MTVEQIVGLVRILPPEDQKAVRTAIEQLPEDEASLNAREAAWRKSMEDRGLLMPRRAVSPEEWERMRNFQPVEITGKPVSETIVEERR